MFGYWASVLFSVGVTADAMVAVVISLLSTERNLL